jgi:integrase
MAVIEKRGKSYRARVRLKGRPDQSRTFPSKAQAAQWALEAEAVAQNRAPKTLADGLKRYMEEVTPLRKGGEWENRRISHFLDTLKFVGERMADVTPDMVGRWRNDRLKIVGPASVRRELTVLSGVFELAKREWRWCSHNPVRDVRKPAEPPHRERLIADGERDQIVARLGWTGGVPERPGHEVAIAFLLALETAMRATEVLTAVPDLESRVARLSKTKNGFPRDVPLTLRAVELYKLIPDGFTLSSASLDRLFRKARDAAGLRDIHFHDTRHTAITRLARKIDVLDLARMTGHRDLKSLQIYYNAPASEIAARLD